LWNERGMRRGSWRRKGGWWAFWHFFERTFE